MNKQQNKISFSKPVILLLITLNIPEFLSSKFTLVSNCLTNINNDGVKL